MMFLLNDQILDVREEIAAVNGEYGLYRRTPSLYQAVKLGQRVVFASRSFRDAHPSAALRIAALIAMGSEANAALFVCPTDARAPSDIAVRLASVPLTTLAWLNQHDLAGALHPGMVNEHVWSLASAPSAA